MNGDDPNVILKDNYITIKKVNRSHSALYQCLAEDGSKTPAMEAINVVVHCKLIVHFRYGLSFFQPLIISIL